METFLTAINIFNVHNFNTIFIILSAQRELNTQFSEPKSDGIPLSYALECLIYITILSIIKFIFQSLESICCLTLQCPQAQVDKHLPSFETLIHVWMHLVFNTDTYPQPLHCEQEHLK